MVMEQRRPRTLRNATKPILPHQNDTSHNQRSSKPLLSNVRQYILDPTKRTKLALLLLVAIGLLLFHNKRSNITNKQLFDMQEYESKKNQIRNNFVSSNNDVKMNKLHDKSFDADPVNSVGASKDDSSDENKEEGDDNKVINEEDNIKEGSEEEDVDYNTTENDDDGYDDVSSSNEETAEKDKLEDSTSKIDINDTETPITNKIVKKNQCSFRTYPKQRFYGLPNHTSPQTTPNFLTNTPYIHGKHPILLIQQNITKICINSTSWETTHQKLKFSDGQNPSILHVTKKHKVYTQLLKLAQQNITSLFVAVVTIGDSQCIWKNTPQEMMEYNLSSYTTPPSKRTLFMLLNAEYETLYQSTLYVHASKGSIKWGNRNTKIGYTIQQLDDARIFWYNDALHVSYRNGKHFGYSSQVHNRIHINTWAHAEENIYIKVEESVKLDGGRNFAMFESKSTTDSSQLYALTWVDPVTVVKVNMDDIHDQISPPRVKKERSTIHGTNGMLLPIKIQNEYELLGIAHFHRPEDRQTSDYARHGHHYTHAFYTITSKFPFKLLRLSQEFLFPNPLYLEDGDLIQFAAGIDSVDGEKFVVSYGINDCEGAIIELEYDFVIGMLGDSFYSDSAGNVKNYEVINFMKNVVM